jgi:O-antigen/teichoic acid export membrane protein
MQFLVLATLIPNIIMQYTLPRDSSGENNDEIKKYIIIFSILIAISGIIIGPTIINLVFPEYSGTIEIIQIMILAIIPKTISLMYMSKFLGMEKSKFVIVGSIVFVLVQIPTIILFGEIAGIIGIAISLVVAETAQAIFYIISNKFLMVKIK